ncbi:hypothetical protein ACVMII_005243 [Bradyrhizobium diazoefficiens]
MTARSIEALLRQLLHQLDKTLAFLLAEQVFRRHRDVVEEQLRRVGSVQADLVEVAPALVAVRACGLDHDQRNAFRTGFARARDHDDEIGGLAIGDESLLAVDDVGIALLLRRGLHGLEVIAGAGLGHGDGADHLAARHLRQPALLLLLRAVIEDVVRDDGAVHGDAGRQLRHRALEIIQHGGVIGEGCAQPAIFLRHARQERAHLAEPAPGEAVHHLLLAPFFGMRRQVLGKIFPELVAKDVELFGHPGGAVGHGHLG